MIGYKFLGTGGVAPFSSFAWPTGSPGPWVEAEPHMCASGIHACRAGDLPFWINAELWEIELDGAVEGRARWSLREDGCSAGSRPGIGLWPASSASPASLRWTSSAR